MVALLWFVIGVVVASVGWFFVWRNNKNRFEELDKKFIALKAKK